MWRCGTAGETGLDARPERGRRGVDRAGDGARLSFECSSKHISTLGGKDCSVVRWLPHRSLHLCLLSTALVGCGERYVNVSIPPAFCTVSSAQGSPRCGPTVRFAWATTNPAIPYPPVLVQAGVTGSVAGTVWIDSLGLVDSLVLKPVTNSQFLGPIERTVRKWRFRPLDLGSTSSRTSAPRGRRPLPIDFLFRIQGCPSRSGPGQKVVPLQASLLVEIVACAVEHRRTLPF